MVSAAFGSYNDIAMCPGDTTVIYGILAFFGEICKIDLKTGITTKLSAPGPPPGNHYVNSLVCDGNGHLYGSDLNTDTLFRFDLGTNKWSAVGSLGGHYSSGDLTYYNGKLYLSTIASKLLNITLDSTGTKVVSAKVEATMNQGSIYGVNSVTFPTACGKDVKLVASANWSLYFVDPVTGNCTLACANPGAGNLWGATTATESVVKPDTTMSITTPPPVCKGNNVTVTVHGGRPYNYSWSPGGYTDSVVTIVSPPAGTTTYTVTGTDTKGCTRTITVNVVINPLPTSVPTATPAKCGVSNGSVKANAAAGTSPFTYSWSNGGTTANLTNIPSGIYTVSITDKNGCTKTSSITVPGSNSMTATSSSTNVKCFGGTDGSATITPTSGTAPYTYSWSNGQAGATATALAAGSYTCVVNDNSAGCSDTIKITLTQPAQLKMQASGSPTTCFGSCDGQANSIPGGGTTPYTYSWSNGSTLAGLSSLCKGSYVITLMDKNSCTHDTTVVIAEPPAITATNTTSSATCGQSNGSASITAGGGTPGYTYSWDNGSSGTGITNVLKGTYKVFITDSKGCKDTVSVIVPGGSTFSTTPTLVNPVCFGDKNGSIAIAASGGTPPFSYNWNTGQTTASISNIGAGNYMCVINDNSGSCADTVKITLTQPTKLILQGSSANPKCYGVCSGQASITPAGGTSPYTYLWNNGAATGAQTGLCAGPYTITLSDANNCTHDTSMVITQPTDLTFTKNTNATTCGKANGNAMITVAGGTPTYSYSWNTNATTSNLSNVTAGTYTLSVTDANGCQDTVQVTIPNTAPYTVTTASATLPCHGDKTGNLSIAVNGTTSPYTYSWSSGQMTNSISNLPAGKYTVLVTDKNGCTTSVTDTITEPTPLLLTSGSQVICNGLSATLNVNSSGGTPPYTYLWNNTAGKSAMTASPSATTLYTVQTVDANGCTIDKVDTIKVNAVPQALFRGPNVCVGLLTSFVDSSTISGGTISSWNWDFGDGQTTGTQSPIHKYTKAGTYNVTLTVSNGNCTSTITHPITVYPLPTADFTANPQPTSVMDPVITFTDISVGGVKGRWYFGDLTDTSYTPKVNPVHTYPNDNIEGGESYNVKLYIVNQWGCPDSIVKPIHIDPEWTFYAPNAMSPNGDGINDTFFGTGIGIVEKEMWIFDRWGLQIFHTTDINGAWDGKVQGGVTGALVQQDVYVWKIRIKEVFGNKHFYIGHVTVVR